MFSQKKKKKYSARFYSTVTSDLCHNVWCVKSRSTLLLMARISIVLLYCHDSFFVYHIIMCHTHAGSQVDKLNNIQHLILLKICFFFFASLFVFCQQQDFHPRMLITISFKTIPQCWIVICSNFVVRRAAASSYRFSHGQHKNKIGGDVLIDSGYMPEVALINNQAEIIFFQCQIDFHKVTFLMFIFQQPLSCLYNGGY